MKLIGQVLGGLSCMGLLACGVPPWRTDAGAALHYDAGSSVTPADSGVLLDAGDPDAGSSADAGADSDAGSSDAGSFDAGGYDGGQCGPMELLPFVEVASDEGWPAVWPTCASDCTQAFVERFSDQTTMDAWFAGELQVAAPTVSFAGTEAVVVYDCGCPTRGYSMHVNALQTDGCRLVVAATVLAPSPENCVTDPTFQRVYAVAVVAADAGSTVGVQGGAVVKSCGP